MNALFTYGYGGNRQALADLRSYIAAGCEILDIRFCPRSGVPGMSATALANTFGGYYTHCRELGNVNHRTYAAGIRLADEQVGMAALESVLEYTPVVLLCGCKSPTACHRSHVARLAQVRWPEIRVRHLEQGERLRLGASPQRFLTAEGATP